MEASDRTEEQQSGSSHDDTSRQHSSHQPQNTQMGVTNVNPPSEKPKTKRANRSVLHVWTEMDEQRLFELQEEFGNSWSLIARKLNKSDNAVKNRFYSTFRKSVRHINKFIKKYCRRLQLKTLSNHNLLGILAACQETGGREVIEPELLVRCQNIKKTMFRHAQQLSKFDRQKLIELISEFIEVSKLVKNQRNDYAQLVMTKIKQKTGLAQASLAVEELSEEERELLPTKELPLQDPPKQMYMLTPMPSQQQQLMMTQDPRYYQLPSYYPQQPIYYMMMPPTGYSSVLGVSNPYSL